MRSQPSCPVLRSASSPMNQSSRAGGVLAGLDSPVEMASLQYPVTMSDTASAFTWDRVGSLLKFRLNDLRKFSISYNNPFVDING